MRTNSKLSVIFVILVVAVIAGEVYVYTFDTGRYGSEVSIDGDTVSFEVTSGISTAYSVVITDNGDFRPNTEYYIYYDDGYGSAVNSVSVPVGARPFTQDYYISQLIHMLNYRGIANITVLDAEKLNERLNGDVDAETCTKGLIVLSGALPDTIYAGQTGDRIFEWLENGGRLYWAGNLLGKYVAVPGGIIDLGEENDNYQIPFFGAVCLNTGSGDAAYSDDTSNEYRYALSLMNNSTRYGVDTSGLPGSMHAGYVEGDHFSMALTEYGTKGGMICVLGGDYSSNQRHDLAQVISSGLGPHSVMLGHAAGDLKRTAGHGSILIGAAGENISAYVYFGGYYPIYGKLTELMP